MTKHSTVVGFDFQIIPLQEAQNLVMAGDGNYAELKAKILETLPNLQPDQAFAFGLPKGEVPEDQRRGIVMALNATLNKAKYSWKVTYSGTRHLFVVVPKTGNQREPLTTKAGNHQEPVKPKGFGIPGKRKPVSPDEQRRATELFKAAQEFLPGKGAIKLAAVVGLETGLSKHALGPVLGLKPDSVSYHYETRGIMSKEIAAFKTALNGRG